MAAAKKHGVEDFTAQIAELASSSNKFYANTNSGLTALISQAAAITGNFGKLQGGTLLHTKQGNKDTAAGIDTIMKQMGIDLERIGEMSSIQLMRANQIAQSFGAEGIGELKHTVDALREAGMTSGEVIAKITKELENNNLTEQERLALTKKMNQTKMSGGFGILSNFAEIAKAGNIKNISGVFEAMTKDPAKFAEMRKEIESLGISAGSPKDMMKAVANSTAKSLVQSGGKDFSKQISKAFGSGDIAAIRSVLSEMNDEQQRIGTEESKNLDPISKAAYWTERTNESIRKFTGPAVSALLGIFGITGLILAQVTAIAASMAVNTAGSLLSNLGGGFGGMLGGDAKGRKRGRARMAGRLATFGRASKNAVGGAAMGAGELGMIAGGGALRGGMAALRVAGGVLSKVALPLTLVLGAIGGLVGGFKAAANAASIFGVEQDKLTLSQKAAAGTAGALTGIVNFLTFGLFKGVFGADGVATKYLSKFIHFAWKLSGLGLMLDMIGGYFKGVWAFWKAFFVPVFEGLKEVWKSIKVAGASIIKPFKEIWKSIKEAFAPIKELFGLFGGNGGFSDIMAWLGKAIGTFVKGALLPMAKGIEILGKVAEGFIRWFIQPLVAGISFIGDAIRSIVDAVKGMVDKVKGWFDWFGDDESETTAKSIETAGVSAKSSNTPIKTHAAKQQFSGLNGPTGEDKLRAAAAQPMALHNVHDRIQHRMASKITASGNTSMAELQTIANASKEQVVILNRIDANIAALAGGGKGKQVSTRSNVKPKSSPNFYTWQLSKYNTGSSTQVIDDGVS